MAGMDGTELPMHAEPHDTLRLGLSALKDDAAVSHPVESIQNNYGPQRDEVRLNMMKNLYGSGLPARMAIEKQILSRISRLPGMPSSNICLESLTGELDDFSFESYLGSPADPEVAAGDMRSAMESKLGLGMKQQTRTII